MPRPEYALKTFVHRILALRLFAAGVLVAVAFAAIVYMRGYERISDVVVLTARHGIERIRQDARRLIETTALDLAGATQQALDAQPEQQVDRRHGQFV